MLAAEPYHKSILNQLGPALSEIHSSTILLHHAREGYDYPTIRLPHTLSNLAGLTTRIYQTLHEGALAFLVVITGSSPVSENASESSKTSALTWRRSCVQSHQSIVLFTIRSTKSVRFVLCHSENHSSKEAQQGQKVAQN